MEINSSPHYPVEIEHVRQHYDRLSFLYRLFWGEHLHHGYWDGTESASRAQIQLMERLAERAGVPRGAHVLDIGCGLGGSVMWLAKQFEWRRHGHDHQSGAGAHGDGQGQIPGLEQPRAI